MKPTNYANRREWWRFEPPGTPEILNHKDTKVVGVLSMHNFL